MTPGELVCFHHAGGGSASFNLLRRALRLSGSTVNITQVELPGRGARSSEPRFVDAEACAVSLAGELAAVLGRPHVLLGHSMGALLAYLVARQRVDSGLPAPAAVVVVAARAPHLFEQPFDLDEIDNQGLALELAGYGGLPAELLARPEWLDQLMPTVRDDLRICRSYRPSGDAPLPCPLHIFGAYDDPVVPSDALAGWADYSLAPQPIRLFAGDHFLFRRTNPDLVAAIAGITDNAFLPNPAFIEKELTP